MNSEHFVYLYSTHTGKPIYVGYGKEVSRALSHTSSSHNEELERYINNKKNKYEIKVSGPYRDKKEAKNIEAAMIWSLHPRFNKARGSGPKFLPVGVPPKLWNRPRMKSLSLSQIGRITGGALLVYLAGGNKIFDDGRTTFDPGRPLDRVAVSNIEKRWDIGSLLKKWEKHPETAPNILIGIHGAIGHRFIVGALAIDKTSLGNPQYKTFKRNQNRWQVPLKTRTKLDEHKLRGRLVTNVKFDNLSHLLHIWVDGNGHVRHPVAKK